jgi:threonine/homoserine/homoserine lactone efflux protein
VLFMIAAVASFVLPSTGSVLALAPVNWGTALGALCFFIGAVLLWRGHAHHGIAGVQPLQPKEV